MNMRVFSCALLIACVSAKSPPPDLSRAMDYIGALDNSYWKDLDVIYPMRRYQFSYPPLVQENQDDRPLNCVNDRYNKCDKYNKHGKNEKPLKHEIQTNLGAMMDKLLFIRRLPGGG